MAAAPVVQSNTAEAIFGDDLPTLVKHLERIVNDSFRARGMRNVTHAEIKRRINFCLVTAAELRRTLGWPTERVVDQVPLALKAFIDRVPWEPDTRASWTSQDDTWDRDN